MNPAPQNGLPDDFLLERAELDELCRRRIETVERIAVLRKQVAPYYETRRNIANAINHTHDARRSDQGDAVVVQLRLDRDSCARRRDLFPRLDELRREYRPALDELSYLQKHAKALDKQIAHIEAWIEKASKRKRRPAPRLL